MPNWKKQYCKKRNEFKAKLYKLTKSNKVYIPMIFETYSAYQLREHIHCIWELLIDHPEAKEEYTEKLMGKMLTGRNEILRNLCYIDKSFREFKKEIPEQLAMGDALAVAYRVQRENRAK